MANRWHTLIRKALQRPLPGDAAHVRMLPPGRSLPPRDQLPDVVKNSSVLILLFPDKDEIYCCLLKRQPYLRHHGGQVGFPGGRMEKGDKSLLHTALRESKEEIGLELSTRNIIGTLSPLFVSVSGFLIHPFVAWVSPLAPFVIDHQEVEKLLFFPVLSFLRDCRVKPVVVETLTGPLEVPAWELDGEIIWGATAMILAEFLVILEDHLAEGRDFPFPEV